MTHPTSPIKIERSEDESLLEITLARPKANIVDREMIAAIRAAIATQGAAPEVRTVMFTGDGPHFSFGASVEEHRPEEVGDMLPTFHALFRELAESGKVFLAAVDGFCLGGGVELAAFCHRVFAAPAAKLGSPEIQLGVFAPIASVVLPRRCGQAAADDLLLTGRTVDAQEAQALGLVDEVVDDPVASARAWHVQHLKPHSAASLAYACRASRFHLHRDLREALPALEKQYLEELMATKDACEGIAAFLEKRTPAWSHQ